MNRYEFVLRSTLTHSVCHTTIVDTSNLDHLRANLAAAGAGPLSPVSTAESKSGWLPNTSIIQPGTEWNGTRIRLISMPDEVHD